MSRLQTSIILAVTLLNVVTLHYYLGLVPEFDTKSTISY